MSRRLRLDPQKATIELRNQIDVGAVAQWEPNERALRGQPFDRRGLAQVALPAAVDESFANDGNIRLYLSHVVREIAHKFVTPATFL